MDNRSYYVYVYIDPRNYEEFYYGKGKGTRKNQNHPQLKRIKEIQKTGKDLIIKVIASNLTAEEAFLIEATLLWKLGKWTDNKMSGHYKNLFRPQDTLHLDLPNFDFQRNVHYYNVGECEYRNWDDYVKYGFISAGQKARYRKAMLGFNPGDIFFAYLPKKHGYIGVGKILEKAKMIREIKINGKNLLDLNLKCKKMEKNSSDKDLSEWVVKVKWIKHLERDKTISALKPKLFTSELARASMANQPETVKYLAKKFKVNLKNLLS